MQQIQPEDPTTPFGKEHHLAWMSTYIVCLFELALNKHADILTIGDLRLILDASAHLPHLQVSEAEKEKSKKFLDSIGGLALYKEIALEVREWIFIYEPSVLRKSKERPDHKSDGRNDHLYLQEGYHAILDLLRRSVRDIQSFLQGVRREDISLGMLREYLRSGSCAAPVVKPEALADRYKPVFEKYQKRVKELHTKLGNFRNHVQRVDLHMIVDMGLSGLRDIWAQNSFIKDRIYLEYFGVPEKADQIFKQAFISKIQSNISKQKQNDDGNLYHYVKLVNDFIIEIKNSKDYQGSPEMEIALSTYISNDDFEEA